MGRALTAPAALLAMALSAGAGGVAAAGDTLGASIQSRVYLDDGGAMEVWNRSTVDARVVVEPAPGWTVAPAALVLGPDEHATLAVAGDGEDGAAIDVRLTSAAAVPAGESPSELVLTALVFHEAPINWWKVAEWALVASVLALVALWAIWRAKPWQIRLTRAGR